MSDEICSVPMEVVYEDETTELVKFFKRNLEISRPRILCDDGFSLSVQASRFHYCTPRENLESCEYETVEVGYPSDVEELLLPYADDDENPTEAIYSFVPVEVVEDVIKKHGGVR